MESGSVGGKLEQACEQLAAIPGGWRAFFLLEGTVADAQETVVLLPWAPVQRPGTMTRVFQFDRGIVITTGGQLSDDEGRLLFDVHQALGDKASRALIVPPMNASPKLVRRMYDRHCVPTFPTDTLPNARGYWALAVFFVVGTLYAARFGLRAGQRSGTSIIDNGLFLVMFATGILLSVGFALVGWRTHSRFVEAMSDPERVVNSCWGLSVPSPPPGNT